jgi:hypothetical protein
MVLDLYLNVSKSKRNSNIIDYLCIGHFLFGYALYMLEFPLLYAAGFDIFSQLFIKTKLGKDTFNYLFGDTIKYDTQLTYRFCDTFFIVLGWFVARSFNKK